MRYAEYSSTRLSDLRAFAVNDHIEILVINIQSFEKDGNVINKVNESGEAPIKFIQETCPIVIIDEPQNMETEGRLNALNRSIRFLPCAIRQRIKTLTTRCTA